mmetsp:Transcript_106114/g.332634  ORF Transcript_106114/g.332634 Transcript_106114/m.332634 type:complete len:229 (+) Transcript_106114:1414-2100(+)
MKTTASSDLAPSGSHRRPAHRQSCWPVSAAGPWARAKARWRRLTHSVAQMPWRRLSWSGDRKKPTKVPGLPLLSTASSNSSGEWTWVESGAWAPLTKARMFPWRSRPSKLTCSPGARMRVSGKSTTTGVRQARYLSAKRSSCDASHWAMRSPVDRWARTARTRTSSAERVWEAMHQGATKATSAEVLPRRVSAKSASVSDGMLLPASAIRSDSRSSVAASVPLADAST